MWGSDARQAPPLRLGVRFAAISPPPTTRFHTSRPRPGILASCHRPPPPARAHLRRRRVAPARPPRRPPPRRRRARERLLPPERRRRGRAPGSGLSPVFSLREGGGGGARQAVGDVFRGDDVVPRRVPGPAPPDGRRGSRVLDRQTDPTRRLRLRHDRRRRCRRLTREHREVRRATRGGESEGEGGGGGGGGAASTDAAAPAMARGRPR